MKCETCRFWDHLSETQGRRQGKCHRSSPQVFHMVDNIGGENFTMSLPDWPPTFEDEWCGEHQEKGEG